MLTKKAAHKGTAKKRDSKEIPYVLKDKYLQVTVGGRPFSLDSTHPTFAKMKKALVSQNWKLVPKLVTLAQSMFSSTRGNVQVKNGVVHYKGSPVDSSLTQRIVDMIKDGRDVNHMLLFMDNLYKNPEPEAITEFFDWLRKADLPITDDGCFLAYKSVDNDYKDEHTHTIDNRPGAVIMMPRVAADTTWRTQCSSGFHICSKHYGLYGSKVMAVKVNPRDVIAAPLGDVGKMRVLRYEVLYELGNKKELEFKEEGFSQLEKQVVVELAGERKEMIKAILGSKQIKRAIKAEKISEATIKKASHARLKAIAQRYEVVASEPVTRKLKSNDEGMPRTEVVSLSSLPPLEAARKASGFSINQVADKMGISYKEVAKLEKEQEPNPTKFDKFLESIWLLKGRRLSELSRSAITYSKKVVAA